MVTDWPEWIDVKDIPSNAVIFKRKVQIDSLEVIGLYKNEVLIDELRKELDKGCDLYDGGAWLSAYRSNYVSREEGVEGCYLKLTAILVPKEVIK